MPRHTLRSGMLVALALGALGGCTSQDDGDEEVANGGSSATGGTSGASSGGVSTGGAGAAGSGSGAMAGSVAGTSGSSGAAAGGNAGAGGEAGQGGNAGSLGGTSGTAGTAGAGGASGGAAGATTGGSAGAASGTGGSGGAPTGSMGCGKAVTQTARQWVAMPSLTVSGAMRQWWTYLPNNYDPMRRYPVVFLFHGCGTETNNVAMQNVVGENAVLVRSKAVGECWVTDTNSADIAFFDALVTAVDAGLCVDTSRRFAVGYSSGSWLINTLECVRGGVLRAAASVAGGTSHRGNCTGPSIARLFVHDRNDPDNAIAGNITERDRLITANGCNATLAPVPEDPSPCARYQGCDPRYPVIWCETMGQMHGRQDQLASTAAWGLFTEF